jgi:type IV secretion system protein VirD4
MLHRSIKDGAPHPVVAASARQMLDMAEGERSGVVSTALGCLALYRDPVLAEATGASDFAIEDLVAGPRPVSLYLIVPPEEMSRLKALLRLIINQMLKRLTEVAAREPQGRRVLLLLDEFPQLGRLDFFEHALAYIRGYRLKACLIAQSLNQIVHAYGEHASIIDNAHVRVAFACNDERTARRISDMLGQTTETRAQMNYAGSRMAAWLGHTMVSRQEVPRPLLTPGEVMQLPPDEAIILTGGAPPIRARKVRYYAMNVFKARVRTPFASPRAQGSGLATCWDGLVAPAGPPRPAIGRMSRRSAVATGFREKEQSTQASFDFLAGDPQTEPEPVAEDVDGAQRANVAPPGLPFGLDPDDFDEEF